MKEHPSLELPEPYMRSVYRSLQPMPPLALYTAEQMRAYAIKYGELVKEQCAKLCEDDIEGASKNAGEDVARYLAQAIRDLTPT